MQAHKRPCSSCSLPYSIIRQCRTKCNEKARQAEGILAKQSLENLLFQIDQCRSYLDEYRSHLVRLKTEEEFDQAEMDSLPDDTAKVISDWKMKILACYYRENQARFFGKRGISLLGFMIIINSTIQEERERGIKDVRFALLVTDDTKQDEWSVMCAKSEVYTRYIPDRCSKVWFQADGAGCFSSQLMRCVQPFWQAWTGMVEERNRITPRGGGKTSLDGMFAKLGQVLSSAVDRGASYEKAKEIADAFEKSGGLNATELHTYMPDRTNRLYAKCRDSFESVLYTKLLTSDLSLQCFKHSDIGTGFRIKQSAMYIFDNATDQKRVLPKTRGPAGALVMTRDIGARILEYFGDQHQSETYLMIMRKLDGFHEVGLVGTNLMRLAPRCSSFGFSVNRKTHLSSKKARAGEGHNHPDQRQERKTSRMTQRLIRAHAVNENLRLQKTRNGLFLCRAKCPSTQQYCQSLFLTEREKNVHQEKGKHRFPKANSTTVAVTMASQPGGLVATGSRPNIKAQAMYTEIHPSAPNEPSAIDASCFGKFNRKELSQNDLYHKPDKLVKEMKRMYMIGQDGLCPKKKAFEVWDELQAMRDPKDGGLMFCYSKRGSWPRKQFCELCKKNPCACNGMLPSVKRIGEWMNTQTQNKKKVERKTSNQVSAS